MITATVTTLVCPACGQRDRWWTSVHGKQFCGACHPPATKTLVRPPIPVWVDQVITRWKAELDSKARQDEIQEWSRKAAQADRELREARERRRAKAIRRSRKKAS